MPLEPRSVTIIVPTYNMGRFLGPLYDSVVNSDFAGYVKEFIFVSDGSTDGTAEVVSRLGSGGGADRPGVRLVELAGNAGTFRARWRGAVEASTEKLLFIDSRITLPRRSASALAGLVDAHPALVAHCDVDETKNIYGLYWRRAHDRFYRSESSVCAAVTIDAANYDRIPFGSTCFACPRAAFLNACGPYLGRTLWSDDTLLFADLVRTVPFRLDPRFRIEWRPRDRWWPFLKRLFDRGPGLAQYHFFHRRGKLFFAVALAVVYGLLAVAALSWSVGLATGMASGALLAVAMSTALISRSPGEFIRLMPLHVAVVAAYGFGSLWGAVTVMRGGTSGDGQKEAIVP